MQLRFHLQRTVQAVAELLKCSPGQRMNYMRLLKLLYIAERELLAERAQPITGDQPVAMERGPVLSHTYALILGNGDEAGQWAKYLRKDHYDICLAGDPERGQLSKAILDKLHDVARRHEEMDEWDMVEATHQFAEWKKNYVAGSQSSFPIPWDDALIAQGKGRLAAEIESDERSSDLFDAMIQG